MLKNTLCLMSLTVLLVFASCNNEKTEKNTIKEEAVKETPQKPQKMRNPMGEKGIVYMIMPGEFKLNWIGTKVGSQVKGTIDFAKGFVNIDGDDIVGGAFILNMESITVLNKEGEDKTKLENHLKGYTEGKRDHFFNVIEYPWARIDILEAEAITGDDNANYKINGNLTMKAVTKPISFNAMITKKEGGVKVDVKEITFDRTEWGVNYNSKKIFPNLQDALIDDMITVSLSFEAKQM